MYTPAPDRYAERPAWFRRAGRSGLVLPAISLGCWHNFGGSGTDAGRHGDEAGMQENCRRMLFAAFDAGVTHFDLANNYGPPPGSAEERVGRILKEDFAGYRDELIISTKAGYTMWAGPYGDWGSRKYLLASLDASLKRLKLDYVDIFYHHRFDPHTPLEETLGALESAVQQGKALYTAVSNYPGRQMISAARLCQQHSWHKPVLHQPNYSMLQREPETDLLPVVTEFGIGTIAFCPLAQGVLTDKYLKSIPADSRVAQPSGFLKADRLTPTLMQKVSKLNTVAQARGQTLAQMALQWVLRPQTHGMITSALIGASRPEQITENVKAVAAPPLSGEELQKIEGILA